MKKKNGKDIIDEFKQLESELISLLIEPFELDENEKNEDVKKHLKKYILRVNKAREVFDKYEMTAKKIELAIGDEDEPKLSHSVVDLRENKDQKVMPTLAEFEKQADKTGKGKSQTVEYEDAMIDVGSAKVLVKKKKSKSQKTREM